MLTLNFNPFPLLESERLFFRAVTNDDAPVVLQLRSNPETMKYIPRPLLKNIDDALEHIKMIQDKVESNEGINWAVCLKENHKMIGFVGHYRIKPENYRSEIGYMILPEYHNKGYVSEAVKVLLDYGFKTLNFHSIEAIIDPDNLASEKVLQKNGFVKEAHLVENEYYNETFIDTVIYSLLKRNYK
jgi:[ribosomal protein S5]-alanine N-acetyltransferase